MDAVAIKASVPSVRAALCTQHREAEVQLKHALQGRGWSVDCFPHEEAFAKAHFAEAYQTVIVLLPGAAGQELAIRAKAAAPDCALIWGSDDPGFARSAFRIRATDFFLYPCEWERMQEALQKCEEEQEWRKQSC